MDQLQGGKKLTLKVSANVLSSCRQGQRSWKCSWSFGEQGIGEQGTGEHNLKG